MRNRSENQITLVLIRHGATKANNEHRYLGKTDEELSKEGETKLLEYKKMCFFPKVDFLFSSPMKRCIQTAEILYPESKLVEIEEWKEIDFGIFEGKNYLELQRDKRYQEWIDSNGTLPFSEGESREVFIARCDRGFQKMIEKLKPIKKEGHKTVGIIVHGGIIMALLSKYCEGEYFDYQVPNGKGFICTMNHFDAEPEIMELKKI